MKNLLRKLWDRWKRLAHRIGRFQTGVILTLVYFLVISPWGILMRLFGWDPLETRQSYLRKPTNWKPMTDSEPDLDSMRRLS
ncbi:MAG: SxtJ family membrane protein [Candidatus Zixiibacteriota bacterium]